MDAMPAKLMAIAAIAAGGIIFCGALYAIFYALGRLADNVRLIRIGFLSYAGLLICTTLLANALNLRGIWLGLVPCLLLGYLLAPPLIWRVCVGVRAMELPPEPSAGSQLSP
jgi:hypothetical protein